MSFKLSDIKSFAKMWKHCHCLPIWGIFFFKMLFVLSCDEFISIFEDANKHVIIYVLISLMVIQPMWVKVGQESKVWEVFLCREVPCPQTGCRNTDVPLCFFSSVLNSFINFSLLFVILSPQLNYEVLWKKVMCFIFELSSFVTLNSLGITPWSEIK